MTREAWQRWIESLGGELADRVTKRTDLLLVGEEPGVNKIERARQLGIPMLNLTLSVYLGLFDKRSGAPPCPISDIIAEVSIQIALTAEELYAQARAGDPDAGYAFGYARSTLQHLLQTTWGGITERPDD